MNCVSHMHSERPRVALIAVLAYQCHLDSVCDGSPLPNQAVEAHFATVQRVGAIVRWNLILMTIKRKLSECNAVPVPSHDRAKVRRLVRNVAVQSAVSQHYIGNLSAAIRCLDRNYACPEGRNARLDSFSL